MPPVLLVPKVTAVVLALLQTTWLTGWITSPVGFTVIVKVLVGPVQLTPPLVNVGVTTIVAITGAVPVLVAVNDEMFPIPDAKSPIPGVSFVHAYVVVPPVLFVPKIIAEVLVLLQTTWLTGWITSPVGLTVIVKVLVGPVQLTPPLVNVGVTTIVAITGAVPVLVAVNEAMFPVPNARSPIDGVSFVQAKVVVPPVLLVPKIIAEVLVLLQTTWLAGWITSPVGLTVIVKVLVGPVQGTPPLVKVGVTTMVATTGEVPVFTAVKAVMFPVPNAKSPIPGVSFVQAYVVVPPVLLVPKITAVVLVLLQSTWLAGWITSPVGFTVIVKVLVGPVQGTPPLVKVGVTTMVATTGEVPVFTAVKTEMSPLPEAARPMLVTSFVQAYVVVPPVLLVPKITAVVLVLLHTTWLVGWITSPVGLTVIVKVFDGPLQLVPPFVKVGVTVIVATTGAVPVFEAVNEAMLPVPEAARPMLVTSFVQA